MSDSSSSVDRIDRAILLVKLERLGEAADLLQPLVPNDDRATQMLAAIYTDLKRGAESDPLYASVLEKFLPRAPTDRGAAAACKAAFAGLADNARMAHRPAEVEAVLSRGLRELPAEAAHFHFLLGRHYHDAGRYGLATEHLNEATRLDSTSFGTPADELLRQIRTSTPGCFAGGNR